jgi:hypothetical protein
VLLAGKGSSFALRDAGLKMLAAAGATPSVVAATGSRRIPPTR